MKETQLALPPIEQQAITESNSEVKTWEYTNRNTVMYNPDGKWDREHSNVTLMATLATK